ncbi:MAG: hypothetical protein KKB50_06670 [Planctomycetes bacterium]|nr:hypothetical protein [Planctomycetota bacterium]
MIANTRLDMRSSSITQLDEKGRVAGDLPCVSCGYNLYTLSAAGACPECNAPVHQSLQGDDLRFAPRAWLRQVRNGMVMLQCGFGAAFLFPAALIFLFTVEAVILRAEPVVFPYVAITAAGVCLIAVCVAFVGLLWATVPDPTYGLRPEGRSVRRITRWSALLLAVAVAGNIAARVGAFAGYALTPLWGLGLGLITAVLFVLLGASFTRFLVRLLARHPASQGVRAARVANGAMVILLCVMPVYAFSVFTCGAWNVGCDLAGVLFLVVVIAALLSLGMLWLATRRASRELSQLIH